MRSDYCPGYHLSSESTVSSVTVTDERNQPMCGRGDNIAVSLFIFPKFILLRISTCGAFVGIRELFIKEGKQGDGLGCR